MAIDAQISVGLRAKTLAAHIVVLAITGCPIYAADALQQLIIQSTPVISTFDPMVALQLLHRMCGLGVSISLLSTVAARYLNTQLGPRVCGLLGHALYSVGLALIITPVAPETAMYVRGVALMALGCSHGLELTSHSGVICLFPGNSCTTLLALGVGSAVSLVGPWLLNVGLLAASSVFAIGYILGTTGLVCVLDILFLPSRPITPFHPSSLYENAGVRDAPRLYEPSWSWMGVSLPTGSDHHLSRLREMQKSNLASSENVPSKRAEQPSKTSSTSVLWIIGIFFTLSFLRWKIFLVSYRPMLQEMLPKSKRYFHFYADSLGTLLPYAALSLPTWSYISDRWGPLVFMAVSNFTGMLSCLCLIISSDALASAAVILFTLHFWSVPAQGLVLVGLIMGCTDLQHNVSVLLCITGAISFFGDITVPTAVMLSRCSYFAVAGCGVALSGIGFLCIALLLFPRRRHTKTTTTPFMYDSTVFGSATGRDFQLQLAELRSLGAYPSQLPLVLTLDTGVLQVLERHVEARQHRYNERYK